MTETITIDALKDELGEYEEFTWDLLPVVDPSATLHLDTTGLPKAGTRITPGMILVGKIGKTRNFERSRQPTALDLHGLSFDELRLRYGDMWSDGSFYATPETAGVVEQARLEIVEGRPVAVVRIASAAQQDSPADFAAQMPALRHLNITWVGNGAMLPTASLLVLAREVLELFDVMLARSSAGRVECRVCATASGGILIDWEKDARRHEVELKPDGSIDFSDVDKSTGVTERKSFHAGGAALDPALLQKLRSMAA